MNSGALQIERPETLLQGFRHGELRGSAAPTKIALVDPPDGVGRMELALQSRRA